MTLRTLLPAAALLALSCAPSQTLRFRAAAPPADEAVRRVRIAMELEGYAPAPAADPRTAATAWKTEASGESRISVGVLPRGRMYEVSLSVERRAGQGANATAVGREDPLFQKWEKILRAIIEEEPREE